MNLKIFKTRETRLLNNLKSLKLSQKIDEADIQSIIGVIKNYEKTNLNTIKKLKREKVIETRKITGALKQTIQAHGPITNTLIGSATKRIYGSLLTNGSKEHNPYFKIHKATVYLAFMLFFITTLFIFLTK